MKNKIDQELFTALNSLPGLTFPRAVKQDTDTLLKKREAFLASGTVPKFKYSRAHEIDVEAYLESLKIFEKQIEQSPIDPIIKSLYQKKMLELRAHAWLIRAICRQDDQLVTRLSKDLFGPARQSEAELREEFKMLLVDAERFKPKDNTVTAEIFAGLARQTLDHYGLYDWQVEFSAATSIAVAFGSNSEKGYIRIPKNLKISKRRAARLLTHEIEVHALRTFNGGQNPILLLSRGLDKYLQTEEGLAIYFQNQLSTKLNQHAPGFWDAWAIALTEHLGFAEVFETIATAKKQINEAIGYPDAAIKAEDAAWRLCLRAYRGIADPSKPGVGFWRDHIYRSGHKLILELQKKYPEMIDILFVGNIGVQHLTEITKLNLPKAKTPELISKKLVNSLP